MSAPTTPSDPITSISSLLSLLPAISLPYSSTTPLLKLNTAQKNSHSTFYSPSSFCPLYLSYISHRLSTSLLSTDPSNHLQLDNCLSILYLDVDFYDSTTPVSSLPINASAICDIYTDVALSILSSDFPHISVSHIFKFIPVTFPPSSSSTTPGYKSGAHVFLYLTSNINSEERLNFTTNLTSAICSSPDYISDFTSCGLPPTSFSPSVFPTVFDFTPLLHCQALLPFAEKVGASRRYTLTNADSLITSIASTLSLSPSTFILPSLHTSSLSSSLSTSLSIPALSEESLSTSISLPTSTSSPSNPFSIPFIQCDPLSSFSQLTRKTISFISSLRYLHPSHYLFTAVIPNHELRYTLFVKPIFYFLVLCEFFQSPHSVGNSIQRLSALLANTLQPLIIMVPSEQSNSISDLYSHILHRTALPFTSPDQKSYCLFTSPDVARAVSSMIDKSSDNSIYITALSYLKRTQPNLDRDQVPAVASKLTKSITRARTTTSKILSLFSRFLDLIMDNLSYEIEPFQPHPEPFLTTLNIREGCTFDSDISSLYTKTIRTWLRFFIVITYYNKRNAFESVRKAISALVSPLVFQESDSKDRISYIYNKRQTHKLREFPFNQWIRDENSSLLISWFSQIYQQYIDDQLDTSSKSTFISPFIRLLRTLQPEQGFSRISDISPLVDFQKDMKKLNKNILCISGQRLFTQTPTRLNVCEDSPYLPMRNGILEFVTKESASTPFFIKLGKKPGDIYFHSDNYTRYMDAYTNIYYDSHFNFDNPIYKRLERIFDEVYSNHPATRTYVLSLYAQTLHSIGARDQIAQFFGTGAEGKSLVNSMVLMTLGCGNNVVTSCHFTPDYNYKPGQADPKMINPFGLAMTLDAEALIRAQKSSHQTGGTVELAYKRFASVEEPDTESYGLNMNVSTGKKLTGDAVLAARKVFKEPIVFKPKLFITIQSNDILGYSENGPAIMRRYTVVPHYSKFVTAALMETKDPDLKRRNNPYEADTSLSDCFTSDPAYWECMFQLLLPYARRFIRDGVKGLSDIPKPPEIRNALQESILYSTGIVGWLANHFIRTAFKCYSVRKIIDIIIQEDRQMQINQKSYIIDEKLRKLPRTSLENKICSLLSQNYGGSYIFILREEFWTPLGNLKKEAEIIDSNGEKRTLYYNDLKEIHGDDDIDLWFDKAPLATTFGVHDLAGVFIIYHDFDTNNKKE